MGYSLENGEKEGMNMPDGLSPFQVAQIVNQAQLRMIAINTAATLTLLSEFETMRAYAIRNEEPGVLQTTFRSAETSMQNNLNNLWAQLGLLEALGPAPQMHLDPPVFLDESRGMN
jgi:hypothetical protein